MLTNTIIYVLLTTQQNDLFISNTLLAEVRAFKGKAQQDSSIRKDMGHTRTLQKWKKSMTGKKVFLDAEAGAENNIETLTQAAMASCNEMESSNGPRCSHSNLLDNNCIANDEHRRASITSIGTSVSSDPEHIAT